MKKIISLILILELVLAVPGIDGNFYRMSLRKATFSPYTQTDRQTDNFS